MARRFIWGIKHKESGVRQLHVDYPGRGLTFRRLGSLRRLNRVSFLWRDSVGFPDALKTWSVDSPPKGLRAEDGTSLDLLRRRVPIKKEIAAVILRALGEFPHDFRSADAALLQEHRRLIPDLGLSAKGLPPAFVRSEKPEIGVARELLQVVRPLLLLYENPRRFFERQAPSYFPIDFKQAAKIDQTLFRWGYGALWNPVIMSAFAALGQQAGQSQVLALALAEERDCYREGRPRGVKSRRPRMDNTATKEQVINEANEIERKERNGYGAMRKATERFAARQVPPLKSASVKRRMSRARKK